MFDVIIKNSDGENLDIAVDIRFAQGMVEVTIDEALPVLEDLAKSEYIYIEVFGPPTPFGKAKLVEFEIEVTTYKKNYTTKVNAIVGK